ncbi:MAG: NAD-binding protein [Promethearchaeota archaeon]
MISKKITKIKIVLKQNYLPLLIFISWFIVNFFIFFVQTNDFVDSLQILFYLRVPKNSYELFYSSFTEFIIFGLIFSLVTIELFRKYNPATTSREISKKYSDHAVIIGYTHIGKRIADYLKSQEIEYVIIEEDYDLIEDLITNEEAVVNDTPLSFQTLEDAGIKKARVVYIMDDDFEIQMVVNHNVRKLNQNVKIITRIFQDDIAEVISKTYNSEIISTSKYASEVIFNKILKGNYQNLLLIGLNHISKRLIKRVKDKSYLKYCLIEQDEELLADLTQVDLNIICGDPKELSILQKADIEKIDCVINTNPDVKSSILVTKKIRDLNRTCKIISRFFLDSIAEILEKAPFRSEVISSSKHTLELMIEKNMLRF